MKNGEDANIILIGFSTTGKSTIGQQVAARLGWVFHDTDDDIVALAGKTIPAIFAEDGEERFRDLESEVLRKACAAGSAVIANGGGAVLREANRRLMQEEGFIVRLEAKPETIYRRLLADAQASRGPVVRPLLAGENPLARICFLKEFRQPFYMIADWTVHTDDLTPQQVADEILRGWSYAQSARRTSPRGSEGRRDTPSLLLSGREAHEADAPYCEESGASFVIHTATVSYPVFIGWDSLESLGRRMRNAGLTSAAYVIADEAVASRYWLRVEAALRSARIDPACFIFPSGENAKSLATAEQVYGWLLDRHAERTQPIVALGGGVTGDLAGFVAATFQRGMPFVQVPTTLLAMVDSSLGGKTAVNLPRAKNMVGAFHQPRLVLADVSTLTSLPHQELACGWAETIKHGFIADPGLLQQLETYGPDGLLQDPALLTATVRRSAAVKAQVVSEDEREAGRRLILNYGHTLGHALEASLGYETIRHGEAVAIGMVAAAWISYRLGLVPKQVVERHERLLDRFGLPVRWQGITAGPLREAIAHDKKVRDRAVRWVLLKDIGETIVRGDVPLDIVDDAIAKVSR
jgi:3-dehydroquinate synthase